MQKVLCSWNNNIKEIVRKSIKGRVQIIFQILFEVKGLLCVIYKSDGSIFKV